MTDIDSPLSLYLSPSMFSSPKNTSSFLEIVLLRNLFTMLIFVQWYRVSYTFVVFSLFVATPKSSISVNYKGVRQFYHI